MAELRRIARGRQRGRRPEKGGAPGPRGHDGTIAVLDPWEELRYPDKVLGLALRLSFDPAPLPPMPPGASRRYQLALRELDKLVECIFVKASVSPAGLALNVSHAGRATLARENATAIWITRET